MQIRNPVKIALYPLFQLVDLLFWVSIKNMLRNDLKSVQLGHSTFYGDEEFLDTSTKAMAEIQKIDPQLYQEITESGISFVSPWKNKAMANGEWNRYPVENWFIENGVDGLIFGIVTHFARYKKKKEKGWLKHWIESPTERTLRSLEISIDWLRKHSFSEEAIKILENMWYHKMFGSTKDEAYQDGAHNSGGCAPSA